MTSIDGALVDEKTHMVPYTLNSLREEWTETMEEIDYANWEEIGRKKM